MRQAGLMLIAALALLAALALKGSLVALPSPPEQPTAGAFDANRAAARLARILGDQRPHPVDSDANDAVRERLIAEMRAAGVEPRVTDDFTCNPFRASRTIACARVRNLVATIGPAEGRHLLLVSHYDSTFAGPGAADAGIGVATMLEVAANLRGRQLTRPVTFLINEGEEMGLLGARAFLDRDPVAARVEMAINLEARGVSGPAIMFETSRPIGAAIAWYRAAVSRPMANSLSTGLYALIPNSTDVAVFDARPWTILNLAVIGNETRYHSAGDDLAALSRQSLQHMGEQTLEAATLAATGPLPEARGEALYTDLIGRVLVVLPLMFGLVLLGVLLLFFLVEGWRRRALVTPLAAMAGALVLSGALAFAGHYLLQLIRAGDYWRAYPLVANSAVYASALAACVLALLWFARTRERTRLRAAFWLLFLLLGAALSALAPGAVIYFLLPPLAAGLGMAGRRWWSWSEQAGAILAVLFLYLTFGPALGLFEELLSTGAPWLFAPLGAVVLLPALIELSPLLARRRAIWVAAGAVDLAILGWLIAGVTPAYSDDRQQLFTIEYVRDGESARLAVNNDGAAVPFDGAWERTEMPYAARRRWAVTAPAVPVPTPAVALVGQQPVAGGRRLRLRLAANGAETVTLIAPADARLSAAGSVASFHPFTETPDGRFFLRCIGRACDGAELDVVTASAQPVEFTIVGTRSGLPPLAAPLVQARPATARPQYGADAMIAIARARF